ncbi:MAG: hypothetical protein A2X28_00015 [Elusimicrobia bacterium GWA2_56_46]|nr:MAG: hypothetical protein A2X28_00015 [Elusimicrobia bacterium GWA2_56_46]OGR53712.1 MAG: hypothetical protein A2X39_03075 [Elusimicrobia bacterium GWC2_56_31]
MKITEIRHGRAIIWFSAVLLVFLAATDALIVSQQRRILLNIQRRCVNNELALMATLTREALLKKDYRTVEDFLVQWGSEHTDMLEIRAVMPNGFVLAQYKKESSARQLFRARSSVAHEGEHLADLEVIKDFTGVEDSMDKLSAGLVSASVVLVAFLGFFLWYTLSVTAMRPLEKEISERRKAEERLQGALSLLSATLESTADGILVVDKKGVVEQYNQKFAKMWRIPQSVMSASEDAALLQFVSAQLRQPETFLEKVRELYAAPELESSDSLEFKDGRIFERYSQPHWIDGVIRGRVWSFRDVTEKKKLEMMLLQSEKLSAVGQLAAGVAHEINNPLGVILGFAQCALKKSGDVPALDLPLRSIEREAVRCKELVQNLLVYSRSSNKNEREHIDPVPGIQAALSIILARAKTQRVELSTDFQSSPLKINVNKGQLQQVILNLCNNAMDAMPGGGNLAVKTSPASRAGGAFLRIDVSDTGHGIPDEIKSRLFEPFFTTKDVGKGTGLGLALAHEIVENHKGAIEVESSAGKGTVFSVYFPVSGEPPANVV